MTPTPPSEATLCAAYRDQAERYRQAVALAAPLAALIRAGEEHAERLGRVTALLAEVAAVEERGRPGRAEWVRAGGRPGAELRVVLTEVTHLIGALGRALAAAEWEATACHARLAAEIDALIRGRAMRRAYTSFTPTR
jgi:hypothetical protein